MIALTLLCPRAASHHPPPNPTMRHLSRANKALIHDDPPMVDPRMIPRISCLRSDPYVPKTSQSLWMTIVTDTTASRSICWPKSVFNSAHPPPMTVFGPTHRSSSSNYKQARAGLMVRLGLSYVISWARRYSYCLPVDRLAYACLALQGQQRCSAVVASTSIASCA